VKVFSFSIQDSFISRCYLLPELEGSQPNTRKMVMKMKFAKLAFLTCLTAASAVATGQNNSSASASAPQTLAATDGESHKDDYSPQKENRSDCGKKNHKERNKHDLKPAPSKEEQEFDRLLLGIHG
jgi:hypothetical protein